jgi:hypothetical protein
MLSDQPINIANGSLTSGIEPDDSIKAVVSFIKECFKSFADANKGAVRLNEKGLSQKLCIFLNRNAKRQPFFFHPEFMEDVDSGISPQVDIGTLHEEEKIIISDREYGDEDSFFSIEAKRLPTPGSNREKEYVIGYNSQSGGIERFKKGLHGPKTKYAAIVGYVQKEDFNHWFLKINSWIQELAVDETNDLWHDSDTLKCENIQESIMVELFSEHKRILNGSKLDDISLFHFWINLIEPNEAGNVVANISKSQAN